MNIHPVLIPPSTKYCAEVLVLLTSLRARRQEYSAGKRVIELLTVKHVHHKVIDFNRDARQDGVETYENKAMAVLMRGEKLQTIEDEGTNDIKLALPQIFIDGEYFGDEQDLQALEDTGFLEKVLVRELCCKCLSRRGAKDMLCSKCGSEFSEVLPGLLTHQQTLERYYNNPESLRQKWSDSEPEPDEVELKRKEKARKSKMKRTTVAHPPLLKFSGEEIIDRELAEETFLRLIAMLDSGELEPSEIELKRAEKAKSRKRKTKVAPAAKPMTWKSCDELDRTIVYRNKEDDEN